MELLINYLNYIPYGLALGFMGLEFAKPLAQESYSKEETKKNVFFAVLNKFLESTVLISVFLYGPTLIQSYLRQGGLIVDLSKASTLVQFITILVFLDFISYCSHLALHKIPLFWRIHRVHHSSKKINVLSSFRHSFWEVGYHAFFLGLGTSFIDVGELARELSSIVMVTSCYFQHANIGMKVPHWVNYILITPQNHRWHHSLKNIKPKGQNFGFIFSIWDHLLNTHFVPKKIECPEYGVENDNSKSAIRELLFPF